MNLNEMQTRYSHVEETAEEITKILEQNGVTDLDLRNAMVLGSVQHELDITSFFEQLLNTSYFRQQKVDPNGSIPGVTGEDLIADDDMSDASVAGWGSELEVIEIEPDFANSLFIDAEIAMPHLHVMRPTTATDAYVSIPDGEVEDLAAPYALEEEALAV